MSDSDGTNQNIVAILKILSQKTLSEQLCPIYPGDNTIGRASDSAVVISDKTISKKHACILVEGREHFVKDCSSKNKTYRRSAELRPEAYYELCNDLEMTFGEVKCHYLISSPTELPEAMDVDATVPYDVADALRVDSRGPTPELTTSSRSLLRGEEERDGEGETTVQPDDATGTSRLPPEKNGDQTLPCRHGARDVGDDNISPPVSPQLLGSPGLLSPPTAAESSDSPVDREGSAVPRGDLEEDATPFKQTLLLEDETSDTSMPTKTPNTTSSVGDTLQDASTLDYSSTGTDGDRAKQQPQQQQGLREAEVGETLPYGHAEAVAPTVPYGHAETVAPTVPYGHAETVAPTVPYGHAETVAPTVPYGHAETVAPTVPYSTDVGIAPTLPYPQGEGVVDPTVPYGVGPTTGPAVDVQQTIPYNLSDEETDIEDEREHGGDERAAKIPIEQTVPYHLDEEEPLEEEEDSKKQSHCSETAEEVEVVKAATESPHPGQPDQPPKSKTEEPSETVQDCSVPSQHSGTASRVSKTPSPIKPESPDIQLGEDPFDFPKDSEVSSLPVLPTNKGRKRSGTGKTSRAARKTNSVVAAIAESSQEPLSSPASSLNEEPLNSRAKRRKSAKVPSVPTVMEEHVAVQTSQEETTPTSRGRGGKGKGRAKKTATPLTTPKMSASPAVGMGTPSNLSDVEANSSDKPCVLFTGVTDDEAQKVITSLGGKMAASVYECTHLVTDKMRRTVKFLCCLARGCHIVNFKWVDKCKAQRRFVDSTPFVIKDKAFEKQHGFSLTLSREKAVANPGGILSGYNFVLSPQVKPDHEQLGDIIKCTGGSVVSTLPGTLSARHLVLSAEEDASMFVEDEQKGYPVYSTEFLFAAVLKQELELSQHRLTCSNGKEGRKATSRKRAADSESSSRSKRKPK